MRKTRQAGKGEESELRRPICPEKLPSVSKPYSTVVVNLEGECVIFETAKGRYKLCAKPLSILARASYHFALKVAKGEEGCVEPLRGAEPFKERPKELSCERGFATAVEFLVLTLSPTFSELMGKAERVRYDPNTCRVELE